MFDGRVDITLNVTISIFPKKLHLRHLTRFLVVVTKTGNDHKRPETTSKQPQTTSKPPQTNTNHKKMTTNYQQTNTNDQQKTTNDHHCTSNQKSDVLFLLPTPGNYKEHLDFEKHTLGSAK